MRLKDYYNSKVAYYIHGQYDLLMEEGNWRNQINQLNLNGGCSGCPLNFIHSTFLLFLMGRKVENELKLKGLAAPQQLFNKSIKINWLVDVFAGAALLMKWSGGGVVGWVGYGLRQQP